MQMHEMLWEGGPAAGWRPNTGWGRVRPDRQAGAYSARWICPPAKYDECHPKRALDPLSTWIMPAIT